MYVVYVVTRCFLSIFSVFFSLFFSLFLPFLSFPFLCFVLFLLGVCVCVGGFGCCRCRCLFVPVGCCDRSLLIDLYLLLLT